jgi:hypothetical protein
MFLHKPAANVLPLANICSHLGPKKQQLVYFRTLFIRTMMRSAISIASVLPGYSEFVLCFFDMMVAVAVWGVSGSDMPVSGQSRRTVFGLDRPLISDDSMQIYTNLLQTSSPSMGRNALSPASSRAYKKAQLNNLVWMHGCIPAALRDASRRFRSCPFSGIVNFALANEEVRAFFLCLLDNTIDDFLKDPSMQPTIRRCHDEIPSTFDAGHHMRAFGSPAVAPTVFNQRWSATGTLHPPSLYHGDPDDTDDTGTSGDSDDSGAIVLFSDSGDAHEADDAGAGVDEVPAPTPKRFKATNSS